MNCLLIISVLLFVLLSGVDAGKYFERLIVIIFENQGYNKVMKDSYFASLATRGSSLDNFYAIAHPSQPNYIGQIAGSTLGCSSDDNIDLSQSSVVDLLEANGISWRAYEEAYPGNCFTGASTGTYVRKHNPFMSFTSVTKNATRCAHIVPATQLDTDLKAGPIPQFVYYTPDLNNDAHDTNIAYASKWLNGFLEPKLKNSNFINNTVVLLTWDEDDHLEGNHIYNVLLGPSVNVGYKDTTTYTHYSLTRTIEDNWGLTSLGRNDTSASPFSSKNYKM